MVKLKPYKYIRPNTKEELEDETQEYFGNDNLAANVFATKYALCDKEGNYLETTPDDIQN